MNNSNHHFDNEPNHIENGRSKSYITLTERKRRSKYEVDGRNFKCEQCGKSYLSQPALNNHKTSKHKDFTIDMGEKRGRGRPRKMVRIIFL